MRATLALAALLLLAAPAAAQAPDTTRAGAALAAVCPGARVRLYRDVGGSVQGTCGPVADARLTVRDGDFERAVMLSAVREVWVEERATRRGAMIGGAIGAGVLMGAGYVTVTAMCEGGPCTDDLFLVLPAGFLLGGAAGGLLGGGIGFLTKVWDQHYP
jgi:hypothetical protein